MTLRKIVCAAVVTTALPLTAAGAQSLLDRPPNVSGDWVANSGTIQFNFLHRFSVSDAPVRKVSNFPTFLMGVGLPGRFMVGVNYATNSTLAPKFPNEWEFFGRFQPVLEDLGAPVDIGGQIGYNVASEGVDGEVSLAKRVGPARLLAVARVLADPYDEGQVRFAAGGGATVRLGRFVAIAGDVTTLSDRTPDRDERPAWSAGLHIALPNTPHTLSIQATNGNTATLQGLSVGGTEIRYGFEFTVPITLARFFGGRRRSPPSTSMTPPTPVAPTVPAADSAPMPSRTGLVINTVIRGMRFPRDRIEIPVGTTITWENKDPLPHTVTANSGAFDSGIIPPGAKWSFTFTTVGTYDFFCTPHPFMTGVVVVTEGGQ